MDQVRARHTVVLNWRDVWHPEGGGSELYVREVAGLLTADGHRVTVVTAAYEGAPASEVRDGIRYVRRGGHMSVYLWAAWLLLTRQLGRIDEVLEVQNGMPFLATWFTKAPVTVLVHHVHREQWPVVGPLLARVGWFLESRVAVRANRSNSYIAVSEVTRSELVALGVAREHITVAYNGMPSAPEFSLRTPSLSPTLVVLSRLVPHKQIEHAIELIPRLRHRFPDIALEIIGDGWWRDSLLELAHELGVDQSVHFHGHVSDSEKYEILSGAWVHVLPSLKEGWGLAIVEAARVGVPSVAYRSAGGVQESILDGVTGVLVEDEDDLFHQTMHLLEDESLRRDLGTKASVRATEFTWQATASQVQRVLDSPARKSADG